MMVSMKHMWFLLHENISESLQETDLDVSFSNNDSDSSDTEQFTTVEATTTQLAVLFHSQT
jgi:hypothetical protein